MLEPPDSFYFAAASGWLELGNAAEAEAELSHLSAQCARDPDVLELKWLVHAEQANWPKALSAAQKLLEIAPSRPTGWLHRAYALRRLPDGSLQEAWEALLPAHQKFPKETLIPYNLSCYACQMGDRESARKWLRKAMRCGGVEHVRKMALCDQDLKPLWDEIRVMNVSD